MIIVEKLLKKYSWKDLEVLIPEYPLKNLRNGRSAPLSTIAKNINIDELGYTFEDFLEDYEYFYSKFKEKRVLFNILKEGKTTTDIQQKAGSSSDRLTRVGINYNSNYLGMEDYAVYLKEDTLAEDAQAFEILIFNSHCELYGEQELLSQFKNKYSLNPPVILNKFNNKYHLAFDGLGFVLVKQKEASK